MFTLMTSLLQILVTIAAFTALAEFTETLLNNPTSTLWDGLSAANPALHYAARQTIVAVTYIVLAVADFIIIINSIILLFGIDARKPPSCWYFYPWIFFFPIYIIYESAINIHYFVWSFRTKADPSTQELYYVFSRSSDTFGFLLVPLIYWALKDIIILLFWLIVIQYAMENNRAKKALKAAAAVNKQPEDPYQGQVLGGCSCGGAGQFSAISRPQPVALGGAAPVSSLGQQPGTYDRPYCVQRGCGYNPSGPYKIY
jgi:hypothetical protein